MRKFTTKLICGVMAAAMLFASAAICVQAEDVLLIATNPTATSGACGATATWSISGGVLTISGTGKMDNYQLSAAPWDGAAYTSVVISSGITSIGNYAFSASAITSVTIPSTVKSIGVGAFRNCASLASVVIPSGVTAIRNLTFAGCTSLASVTIPASVTSIGSMAFENCTSLAGVDLPAALTEIGGSAFAGCSKLAAITIPDAVTEIPYNAFGYCPSLGNVTIPSSVKTIDRYAFDGSTKVTINAPQNSNAHAFATANKIAFKQNGTLAAEDDAYAWKNPFTDVLESALYYDGVKYVNIKGVMLGMSTTTFEPDTTLNRAMFVTILHRLEGTPDKGDATFKDVAAGTWYNKAVAWAASEGIVSGISATQFDPNGKITNEQMAAIIWRYAKSKGVDVTTTGELSYSDKKEVADWATAAVLWLKEQGIMIGNADSTFAPQTASTRGQAADVFAKYMKKFG